MERSLEHKGFKFAVGASEIKIQGIVLSEADVDKISHLLGIAGNLSKYNALPPEISFSPFQITFGESGTHTIHRKDDPRGIQFAFEAVDDLIQALSLSVDVSRDVAKVSPRTATPMASPFNVGDVFEGRE